ncbi:hypothetical protein ACIHCQ_07150 [Streptomyces sp. NPDC052236]|uniref:hypothetical protein n=1 Tax=Streptomyces sp. NPDC052236 TaxID=3365686 RepID=UPI0037CF62A9
MEYGQPQASRFGIVLDVIDAIVTFLPDWAQWTALSVVVAGFGCLGAVKVRRRIQYRSAVRAGRPVHAAARYGQGRGADYLGSYAPPRRPDSDPG